MDSLLIRKAAAVTHEQFFATVLTESGKVAAVGEGKDGARKVTFSNGLQAVLKPALFSTQRSRSGIARNTRYRREAAAYQLDRQVLQWGIVPPTTLTAYKGQAASIQAWVPGLHARAIAPKMFGTSTTEDRKGAIAYLVAKVNAQQLRRIVLFDLITNNGDRHARNVIFDGFGHQVWAIDNSMTFGECFYGYFNLFHQLVWRQQLTLLSSERAMLEKVTLQQLNAALKRYLTLRDITHTYLRIRWMLTAPNLGWKALAGRSDTMPDHRAWFDKQLSYGTPSRIMVALQAMGQIA